MDEVVERTARILRDRGERMTGPRRAVVTALASTGGHLGVEAVLAAVSRIDPGVHRASVFRALAALSAAGVVQHVHEGHGSTLYHLRTAPHLHAQCRSCGRVLDVRADLLDGAAADLAREAGFRLDPEHVALSGTCADCAGGGRAARPDGDPDDGGDDGDPASSTSHRLPADLSADRRSTE
ncbi:MAG: Fur family transcriptional regulator [Kineosporiaceae bacterium]